MTNTLDAAQFEQAQLARFEGLRRLASAAVDKAMQTPKLAGAIPLPAVRELVAELDHVRLLLAGFQPNAEWLAQHGFPELKRRMAVVLPDLDTATASYAGMITMDAAEQKKRDDYRRGVAQHGIDVTAEVTRKWQSAVDDALERWQRTGRD